MCQKIIIEFKNILEIFGSKIKDWKNKDKKFNLSGTLETNGLQVRIFEVKINFEYRSDDM